MIRNAAVRRAATSSAIDGARVALAVFALGAALAGCSRGSQVLARVGLRVITVSDFDAAARGSWMQYQGRPELAKRELLDDLIKRDLLLRVADVSGLTRDSLMASARKAIEEQVLAHAIGDQYTPPRIPVSDAEVEAFYGWSKTAAHVHLIYTTNAAQAAAAAASLRAGAPFSEVADHVTPTGLLPAGGDLGERTPGALIEPLDGYAMRSRIGAILGPVPALGEGWFVAMVSSRRQISSRTTLDVARPMLEDMVRQRKQRTVAVRWTGEMRERFGVALEPGGSQELFRLFYRRSGPDSLSAVTAEELGHVLARYSDNGGRRRTYTVGDALTDLALSDREAPTPSQLPAIESWLQQQLIRRVALYEARRRGLDRDPALVRTVDEQLNGRLLDTIYGQYVSDASSVSETEVLAEYQRESSQFQRIEAARVLTLVLPDSTAAQALLSHGAHAGTLRDAARMAGLESRVAEERVAFPNQDPVWSGMQPDFLMMAKGEWSGPIRARGGWLVLQLVEKTLSPQPFDKLTDAARQSIQQAALAHVRDAHLDAVTDSLRRVTQPFEIHEDVLRRLPWPPAGVLGQ